VALVRRLNDLPIARRLGAAIALLLLVTVFVGVVGVVRIRSLQGTLEDMNGTSLAATRAAGDVRATFNALAKDDADILTNYRDDLVAQAVQARTDDDRALDTAWTEYLAAHPASTAEQRNSFTGALATWRFIRGQYLDPYAQAHDVRGWVATYNASVARSAAATINATLSEIQQAEQAAAQTRLNEARADVQQAELLVGASCLLSILLGVAFTAVIVRSIVGPVQGVLRVAEAVARGDLTQSTGVSQKDEIGRVAAAQDEAARSLRDMLSGVAASAGEMAEAAEALSTSSHRIAAAAEETSVQSSVVSAAAGEASGSVSAVAQGATELGGSIVEISRNAQEGLRVAGEAVEAARDANAIVSQLGSSSAQIDEVVKVITTIAGQTNLLALNATIEAARAGDAGKGFAVVAEEVKDLARETATATEEISARVGAIQNDTTSAIAAIERFAAIIADINDYQARISAAVEEQTSTTQEMSRSAGDAAGSTTQIAENIVGVAEAAGATAVEIAQTQTAAADLALTATRLRERTATFVF
jgi:methyl-accepting chemotaxis protein